MAEHGLKRFQTSIYVAIEDPDENLLAIFTGCAISPAHPWYFTNFVYNDKVFKDAEIAIFYAKAIMFNDKVTGKKILKANSIEMAYNLAKTINGYNEDIWKQKSEDIVYRIMKRKFKNNFNWLKHTENSIIGILINNKFSALAPEWYININPDDITKLNYNKLEEYGENLLGKTLMRIRNELNKKYDISL